MESLRGKVEGCTLFVSVHIATGMIDFTECATDGQLRWMHRCFTP